MLSLTSGPAQGNPRRFLVAYIHLYELEMKVDARGASRSVSDHIIPRTHLGTTAASRLQHPHKHTRCVLWARCKSVGASLYPAADRGVFGTVALWVISPDTHSEHESDLHITIGQLKV